MSLKQRITDDMKTAMREKNVARLGTIRLLLAAMKQREVDERIELSDDQIVAIIDKMQKQRRDSISQYEAAARQDLADIEKAEMLVLDGYMPQQADEAEIAAILDTALATHGATVAAMGKIMAEIKPKLAGRADMSKISTLVKARIQ
ncbi:GatB/YqeY domain-containing protein [Chitinimonas sp. BJB300]|uniref:GatB/YqeY domain-containing protein n=1 Tax=Chitinimonas sp. BJB300 TaxID=1559339 RepID=UPI000C0FA449|nr:GatB/YqeY domain-containing protein [Chitinimonas sp. BJB300]PHV10767.1 glutamyl-tRNA amidotransferase [Chitinimonas sp. BJB300]TSJ84525.1 GatB/YqeY domain-containing protein [Chitinimonas sp. BJB300]